jgi:hypothetical protein
MKNWVGINLIVIAGFEPALPKETVLKTVAFDHSAISPSTRYLLLYNK